MFTFLPSKVIKGNRGQMKAPPPPISGRATSHRCKELCVEAEALQVDSPLRVGVGNTVRAAGGNVGRWECSEHCPSLRNVSCRVSCL